MATIALQFDLAINLANFQSQKQLYIHKCLSICLSSKPLNSLKSSSFIIFHSSFIILHSSFIHPSFILHHSSSPFIILHHSYFLHFLTFKLFNLFSSFSNIFGNRSIWIKPFVGHNPMPLLTTVHLPLVLANRELIKSSNSNSLQLE